MVNPAQRAWLQTGGMPVEPLHADLRREFDAVDAVTYLGAGCFKLFTTGGDQIGIVQFQGVPQARLDDAVAATLDRIANGGTKPADIASGDTVVRELDMNDPIDRELAGRAITGSDPHIIVPDVERPDPAPIDLPDYAPAGRVHQLEATTLDERFMRRVERNPFIWCVIFVLAAAAVGSLIIAKWG